MPCVNFPFDPLIGPILTFGISIPVSLAAPCAPAAAIYWVKGLVDTGCSNIAISPATALAAGLSVLGKTTVASTTHTVPANIYLGDFYLPFTVSGTSHRHTFFDVRFTDFLHPNPNYEALIGRDVLALGALMFNGQTNHFTFCW